MPTPIPTLLPVDRLSLLPPLLSFEDDPPLEPDPPEPADVELGLLLPFLVDVLPALLPPLLFPLLPSPRPVVTPARKSAGKLDVAARGPVIGMGGWRPLEAPVIRYAVPVLGDGSALASTLTMERGGGVA